MLKNLMQKWHAQPLRPRCWHPELRRWLLFGVGTGRAWPRSPHRYTSQKGSDSSRSHLGLVHMYSQFWPLQWYFFYPSTLPSPCPFLCTPLNALSPFTKVHINFGRPLERAHPLPGANFSKFVTHYKIAVLLANIWIDLLGRSLTKALGTGKQNTAFNSHNPMREILLRPILYLKSEAWND